MKRKREDNDQESRKKVKTEAKLTALPKECLLHIFSFLKPSAIAQAQHQVVNRQFRELAAESIYNQEMIIPAGRLDAYLQSVQNVEEILKIKPAQPIIKFDTREEIQHYLNRQQDLQALLPGHSISLDLYDITSLPIDDINREFLSRVNAIKVDNVSHNGEVAIAYLLFMLISATDLNHFVLDADTPVEEHLVLLANRLAKQHKLKTLKLSNIEFKEEETANALSQLMANSPELKTLSINCHPNINKILSSAPKSLTELKLVRYLESSVVTTDAIIEAMANFNCLEKLTLDWSGIGVRDMAKLIHTLPVTRLKVLHISTEEVPELLSNNEALNEFFNTLTRAPLKEFMFVARMANCSISWYEAFATHLAKLQSLKSLHLRLPVTHKVIEKNWIEPIFNIVARSSIRSFILEGTVFPDELLLIEFLNNATNLVEFKLVGYFDIDRFDVRKVFNIESAENLGKAVEAMQDRDIQVSLYNEELNEAFEVARQQARTEALMTMQYFSDYSL